MIFEELANKNKEWEGMYESTNLCSISTTIEYREKSYFRFYIRFHCHIWRFTYAFK